MARKAVDDLDGKEIEGKTIFVGRAQKKSEREAELRNKYVAMKMERMQKLQGVNLYVKNLSDDIDDDKLREEFAVYGTITSCKIMRDDKGQSRGFGFVCFTQPEEATKAVTELNGRMIGLKPIYVALAQRKEARRAQLEQERNMGQMRMPGPGMPVAGPSGMYGQPNPYMFQQGPGMPQVGGGMAGGRANPSFMNPQYMAAMGRGGPVGRGAPMNPQYMAAMAGRGMPAGINPGTMNPAAMAQYGMIPPQQRQQRQNRQRNGPMAGGPVGPGGPRGGTPGATTGPGQQQFKYAANTRNANGASTGANGQSGDAQAESAPEADADGSAPLTIEQLSAANPAQQKQLLGEKLFPLIGEREPTLAGKITGMLLEMENSDILHLIDTPEALNEQVDEALTVLRAHGQGGEAAATPQAV
jgi:polyadenylate-binding protein